MIRRVTREEAGRMPLPGRTWYTYLGPQNAPTERVSIGVSIFPPGSRPEGHVHDVQEETIYCAGGRGRIVTPDAVAEMEPGVTVWVQPGTPHATESDGPEPLELVCFFSPPVVPGSYERREDA
jgi:quercetin dioxygenase-like cupin family protein